MTLLTVQTKARLQRAIWIQQGKIRVVKVKREEDRQIRGENDLVCHENYNWEKRDGLLEAN